MRRVLFVLAILLAVAGAVALRQFTTRGISTRARPWPLEKYLARSLRSMAIPAAMRAQHMPMAMDSQMLTDARHHFADHCAVCHANNGSGDTPMGRGLYPPAPDMRAAETQGLSDGELYSIIQDGVRLTGMPAWGGDPANDHESWELVGFIRHLPQLTPEEELDMERYNPQSPEEIQEQRQEEDFLNGAVNDKAAKGEKK